MAETLLSEEGECFSFGELIHNDIVVKEFASRGLKTVNSVSEIPNGAKVILRSHGVGKSVYSELKEKGISITDATCPKVANIHDIVSKAREAGRTTIIIGAAEHPEVKAICGWCGDYLVFLSESDLEVRLAENEDLKNAPLTLVFQTTQTKTRLTETEKILKKLCTNAEIFDTICTATSTRQEEARELASVCDAMVVIGGKNSANSVHLAKICGEYCGNVQFINNADELDTAALIEADAVGVTAGASAPAWIIKEVKQKMFDEFKIGDLEPDGTLKPEDDTGISGAALSANEFLSEKDSEKIELTEKAIVLPVETDPVVSAFSDTDIEEKTDSEKSFDELLENSIKTINNGDTVIGIVVAITQTEVSVDLSGKHSGYIPSAEFIDDNETKIEDVIKIGDSIEACVVRVNDVEGTIMLSKRRLDTIKSWADIEAAREDGTAVEGTVTEENKGGIVVSVKGIRVFVPASQTGLGKDEPMSNLLKQKVRLKIKEVNRSRRRVVGSIRDVMFKERRERAENTWNEIETGKHYKGVVKSMTSYGAFVDIGGVDGMVHISELSWNRIKKPSDELSVGDELEVYVIGFDKEKHRISLGYKNPAENPWLKFSGTYNAGDIISVTIVKLVPFGAYAEIVPGVDGLIHISQIADRRIGKPEEVLSVGETVKVKITAIDNEKQKISLSLRALLEPEGVIPPESEEDAKDVTVYEISAGGEVKSALPDETDEDENNDSELKERVVAETDGPEKTLEDDTEK